MLVLISIIGSVACCNLKSNNKSELTVVLADGRALLILLRSYTTDHNGMYPVSFVELRASKWNDPRIDTSYWDYSPPLQYESFQSEFVILRRNLSDGRHVSIAINGSSSYD